MTRDHVSVVLAAVVAVLAVASVAAAVFAAAWMSNALIVLATTFCFVGAVVFLHLKEWV